MVPGRACIQGVLKVKVEVKGHVIWVLLSCHENLFFSWTNGSIATKRAHDGPLRGLHLRYAQGQGQCQSSRNTGTFLISRKALFLAGKWLDRHQSCIRWSPDGPASRGAQGQGRCQRSRDTGTFVMTRKSLLLAGIWVDRHQTCTRSSSDCE